METRWLAHFGIKGQKWGVRRYQNEDGSLTEEGKKKYMSMRPNELGNELHKAIAEERKYRPYNGQHGDIGSNSQKDRENYSIENEEFKKSLEEKYGKKAMKEYDEAYESPDKYEAYMKTLESDNKKREIYDQIRKEYSQFGLDHGNVRIMGQKLPSKALRRIGKTNIAYLKDLGFNDETSRLLNSKIVKADTKFVDIHRYRFSDEFI